jgi:signal recognition particle subunit SRP54
MQKMGGMEGIMGMMPGMAKMKGQMAEAGLDDKVLRRQIALIQSMTKKERANPDLLQASRKRRIAAGAGMEVSELNKLLKMHRQMADVMKKMGKMGKQGLLRQMGGMLGMKGGMPSEAEIAKARDQLAASGALPKGLPGLGGGLQLPPGLSGFGKKK